MNRIPEQFYTLKSHGDECFSGGSEYYKASKSHYLKALGINAGLPEHRACVYRNLAVAENLLGTHLRLPGP